MHQLRQSRGELARKLRGQIARDIRLRQALESGPAENSVGIDVSALLDAIDARLADLTANPDGPTLGPPAFAGTPRSDR